MTGLRRETWNTGLTFREAEVDSTEVYYFLHWIWPNVPGGEFSGFSLEGEVLGGEQYLLAHLVVGCRDPMSVH